MMGVTVSVVVMVVCVVISHVQTAVYLSPDGQHHQVLMVIPPTDHHNQYNVTSESKQRYRRQASNAYNNRDVAGFSDEEKKIIVDKHNECRGKEQASDMMYMTWDEDLEKLAQAWSENCDFNHRPGGQRQNIGSFAYAGENLYASTGTYDPTYVIQAWYDEYVYYNYNTLACTKVCGHYTQVVWASSYAVGCGVKYCPVLRNVDFGRGFLVSCNYGPGGNYRGERPYQKGKACSACAEDAPYCAFQSMCSKFPVIGSGGVMSRDPPAQLLIGYAIMCAILSFQLATPYLTA